MNCPDISFPTSFTIKCTAEYDLDGCPPAVLTTTVNTSDLTWTERIAPDITGAFIPDDCAYGDWCESSVIDKRVPDPAAICSCGVGSDHGQVHMIFQVNMRFGIVNSQTGWHALLYTYVNHTNPSPDPGSCLPGFVCFKKRFDAFIGEIYPSPPLPLVTILTSINEPDDCALGIYGTPIVITWELS